jgi:hypothetical protein
MTRLESKNLLVLSYLLIIVVAVLRIEMINLYNIVAVFSCLLFFAATRPAREIVLRLSLFMGVNIFMTWTRTAKSPSAIATELSVPPRPRDWPLKPSPSAWECGPPREPFRLASAAHGEMRASVVGDVAPRGIFGNGLVNAVAVGLKTGEILPSGRIANRSKPFLIAADPAFQNEHADCMIFPEVGGVA